MFENLRKRKINQITEIMKGRTKFFNYFIACIATLSLATFAACSDDDPETPSGKLVLKASASSFVAGEGNVTFTVTHDGEDVTSQAAITNVTTGEPVENAAWTTTQIGEYKFQAVYDSYTSDPVTVSAIDKNKDKEFYRHVLLLEFTYMMCPNCATAQGYFNALDKEDRDHFLVVAAHQPTGTPMDPYSCLEGINLNSKMKVGVQPTWSYNFEDLVVGVGAGAISKTSIRQQISHAEKTYPAVCGVKATSTLEGSTAKIEATVQFQQAGNYKIACVLVENNIENKETYNTFDHVLRAAQTDMEGDAVTPAVIASEERTFNFEATIGEGWNAENCAFVVYVFKEEANGKYIVNNGAECAVDGSVDYRYELQDIICKKNPLLAIVKDFFYILQCVKTLLLLEVFLKMLNCKRVCIFQQIMSNLYIFTFDFFIQF